MDWRFKGCVRGTFFSDRGFDFLGFLDWFKNFRLCRSDLGFGDYGFQGRCVFLGAPTAGLIPGTPQRDPPQNRGCSKDRRHGCYRWSAIWRLHKLDRLLRIASFPPSFEKFGYLKNLPLFWLECLLNQAFSKETG